MASVDPFEKVSKDQPLEIRASSWNRMQEAAQIYQRLKLGDGRGESTDFAIDPQNLAWFQAPSDLPEFSVLAYGSAINPPTDNPFVSRMMPAFNGGAPSSPTSPFVVTIEPILSGTIGRAAVAGLVPVQVLINDATHTRAVPIVGTTAYLSSAASGGVPIVFLGGESAIGSGSGSGSGPDIRWAIVLLGDQRTSGDPWCIDYFSGLIAPGRIGGDAVVSNYPAVTLSHARTGGAHDASHFQCILTETTFVIPANAGVIELDGQISFSALAGTNDISGWDGEFWIGASVVDLDTGVLLPMGSQIIVAGQGFTAVASDGLFYQRYTGNRANVLTGGIADFLGQYHFKVAANITTQRRIAWYIFMDVITRGSGSNLTLTAYYFRLGAGGTYFAYSPKSLDGCSQSLPPTNSCGVGSGSGPGSGGIIIGGGAGDCRLCSLENLSATLDIPDGPHAGHYDSSGSYDGWTRVSSGLAITFEDSIVFCRDSDGSVALLGPNGEAFATGISCGTPTVITVPGTPFGSTGDCTITT